MPLGSSGPKSGGKSNRFIPQQPDRVLDAPDLKDDWYVNVLDWSATNKVALLHSACVSRLSVLPSQPLKGYTLCLLKMNDNELAQFHNVLSTLFQLVPC